MGGRSFSGGGPMRLVTREQLKAQRDTAPTPEIQAVDPARPALVPRHLRSAQTDAEGRTLVQGDWRTEVRDLPTVTKRRRDSIE
jgi:hypothetical protein